ncbi:LOW QUALITY PROTEIN: uncharacterized protein LOC110190761 [Drosophila serrata]|uniref:LOW QUALITY PROTEIN: uncharacterized protein LOC110190761 n=1 Tax=Drosophila serrata TaxID=7274 RepID=UPI000A1D03BD|nr:LOW QUALITY PROTEIN: uncharacterized protein LOC110190761 [Drosophila serrata]
MRSGLIVGIIWVFIWPRIVHGGFVLKNVICESLDTSYAEFKRCEMKIVRRGVSSFYMFVKVHKLPINSVDVNVSSSRDRTDIGLSCSIRPWITVTTCETRRHID